METIETHELYTDGACPNNGTENATGGFGMAKFMSGRWRKASFRWDEYLTERYGPPTNQKCELMAVLFVIIAMYSEVKEYPKDHKLWSKEGEINSLVKIYSDSQYVVNGLNSWLAGWKEKDWKNSKKQPIANMKMWKDIDDILSKEHMRGVFTFLHVPGHSGNPGNDAADEAARRGASGDKIGLYGARALTKEDWAEFERLVKNDA